MSTRIRILVIGVGLSLIIMGVGSMQMAYSAKFLRPYFIFRGAFMLYGMLVAILGTGIAAAPGIEYVNEKG